MEILPNLKFDRFQCLAKEEVKNKIEVDEEIIRWELVRVWTRLLEHYAQPGVKIPNVDFLRRELIEKGVDAAVGALKEEHWFMFSWMIRSEIRKKIERGLKQFDLKKILEDVRLAQNDPQILEYLRGEIKQHVLFESKFC